MKAPLTQIQIMRVLPMVKTIFIDPHTPLPTSTISIYPMAMTLLRVQKI